MPNSLFIDILRLPQLVRAFGADLKELPLSKTKDGWAGGEAEILVSVRSGAVAVQLRGKGVSRLQLRWHGDFPAGAQFLGDAWERSYGDLQWQGVAPNRVMPWYFIVHAGHSAGGYGVKTGAGALCFWTADPEGISLWADVRSGGVPVELGDRTLDVAELVMRDVHDETPFETTRQLCHQMCRSPRLADHPIYGTNDWNFAYGNNSAELIAGVSGLVSELSPNTDNRPYSVIDEGWAIGPAEGRFGHGPWVGNAKFGDMGHFAERLRKLGVRPGIWFRPLTPLPGNPANWGLSRDSAYLDPTIPEVREQVSNEIRKFVGWGYDLIKHDFTTWDFLGRWGFEMGSMPTRDGWRPSDATRTNAEILLDLYKVIREAAGEARLIGCNTIGHLSAGSHEIQRTGDDTSGRSWNRNRKMGVNTLAFRIAQHRAFFDVDPDIVAITREVPWSLVEQWLRLVSQSGTSLFVAADPAIITPVHRKALSHAFAIAAEPMKLGEPLDWTETLCPRRWNLRGKTEEFAWMGADGAWPFAD